MSYIYSPRLIVCGRVKTQIEVLDPLVCCHKVIIRYLLSLFTPISMITPLLPVTFYASTIARYTKIPLLVLKPQKFKGLGG